MPSLRQVREMLLLAYVDEVIDDDEFVLLFDVNKQKIRNFLIGLTLSLT